MNTFGLDKSYDQIDFEAVRIEDLDLISGGSGGGSNGFKVGSASLGASAALVGLAGATTSVAAAPVIVVGAIVATAAYGGYKVGSALFA